MLLSHPTDKIMFDTLINRDIISMRDWNNWDKPEEGRLFPLLLANAKDIDPKKYFSEALKYFKDAVRIDSLRLDTAVLDRVPGSMIRNLIDTYFALPICTQGKTTWIAYTYFPVLNPRGIITSLPNVEIPGWVIVTPLEFKKYVNEALQFYEQKSRLMRSSL